MSQMQSASSSEGGTICGFICLGSQGAPIARRMAQSGLHTLLWARRREALDSFQEPSVEIVNYVEDMGARAQHIGVCVVDDAGVREVCDRLIPVMQAGSRIAIHSTIHPDTCEAIAAQAAERGVTVIDAPVSGGSRAAEAGTLTVMVGCDATTFEQAQPIFETFGGLVIHLGGVGAGQRAKLINNALMAVDMAAAHRAFGIAEAVGIDTKSLAQLIGASSGRSYGFEIYARLPSLGHFRHGALLLKKDINLLRQLPGAESDAASLTAEPETFLDFVTEIESSEVWT